MSLCSWCASAVALYAFLRGDGFCVVDGLAENVILSFGITLFSSVAGVSR